MTEPERVPEPDVVDSSASEPGAPDPMADASDVTSDDAGPGLPPPTAVESLVGALLEAGPEVAEHVVRAAQELLLAVQVIVDAADRAVQEQHRVHADAARDVARGPDAPGPDAAEPDARTPDVGVDTSSAAAPVQVRHLDIAE